MISAFGLFPLALAPFFEREQSLRELTKRWTRWRMSTGTALPTVGADTRAITQFSQPFPALRRGPSTLTRAQRWFAWYAAALPERIKGEFALWYRVLSRGHDTTPRSRPRHPRTVLKYAQILLPALHTWSRSHDSLREIRSDQARAWLEHDGPGGNAARHLSVFRSLFSTLKRHKMIFSDPAARLRNGPATRTLPLPADLPALRAALAGPDPRTVAATALIAYHALTLAQLRAMHADQLHGTWLDLGERRILPATPVLAALRAWRSERHRRWQSTANPHLFITEQTALTTDQVTGLGWLQVDLRRLGLTIRVLREDRILDQMRATGGDIRRVQALFGLSAQAAYRYLAVLNHAGQTMAARNAAS